jgi:hypothetical protein
VLHLLNNTKKTLRPDGGVVRVAGLAMVRTNSPSFEPAG